MNFITLVVNRKNTFFPNKGDSSLSLDESYLLTNTIMRLTGIEYPSPLKLNSTVYFKFEDGSNYYGKIKNLEGFYVRISSYLNDEIFNLLGLNSRDFVKDVVGYEVSGKWPEVKTLEDLEKVFNALIKVNQPVEEIKEESTPPGEYDWLIK